MTDLTFTLGTDPQGSPIAADLARLPHLLIGGVTGSGKTHCIDNICAQLEGKAEIRRLDAENPCATLYSLRAAREELDARCAAFKAACVKQINEYEPPMPHVVIVLDEYAPLFIPFKEEAEALLTDLAMYGRIAGIHLILSTQKLYPEVVTGMLKAIFPSRIAFRTATAAHSRHLLDHTGAELLKRPGDMLYFPISAEKPIPVHGN